MAYIFRDERLAGAVIDRLTHRVHVIQILGMPQGTANP
jgi:hypothetical protein